MINVIDILNPISESNECGEYLRYDQIYDDIREARREDDPRLPQGVWKTEIKKADWKKVENLCVDVLKNKSKDLQIAIWLLEAYTSTEEWFGLCHGLELLRSLCEKFWDKMYPSIREDSSIIYDYRIAPLVSMMEKVNDKILLLPLTNPDDGINHSKSLSNWIDARHSIKISDGTNNVFNKLYANQDLTNDEFFIKTDHFLQKTIIEINKLDEFLSKNTNNESPSFRLLLSNIKDASVIVENVVKDRGLQKWDVDIEKYTPQKKESISSQEEQVEDPKRVEEKIAEDSKSDNDPMSRATIDQAYAALFQIAKFLEEKQPQNPTSSLINISLYLRNKTFTELMNMRMQDGEPIVNCISKICSVLEPQTQGKFDKSVFNEN